jgi:hypothetical protein
MLRLARPLLRSTRLKQPDFITNSFSTASGLPRPIACHQLLSGSTIEMVPSFLAQTGISATPRSCALRPDDLPCAAAGEAETTSAAAAAARIASFFM